MRWGDIRVLSVVSLVAGASACMPSPTELDAGSLTQTFAVSDYFTPSGYMGDGENFGMLTGATNAGCKQPRPVGARGNCYVFTYYPHPTEPGPWAGVYFVFPANNWGSVPGRAVDTTKFQQIRFSAAVEAPLPFTVSGAQGNLTTFAGQINPKGQYDTLGATLPGVKDHVDGLYVNGGPQVGPEVGPELKTFHMPIDDLARTYNCGNSKAYCVNGMAGALIGGFGWSLPYPTDADPTRKTPVKVYLDDIVWDTEAPPPS